MKKIVFLSLAIAGLSLAHGESVPQERMEARRAFSELKFGMFVHWGLYASFAQGEWYLEQGGLDEAEYAKAANAFYPHAFDAREWVRAFKSAGAKYVVFTTRHHDGFSMFDTKATDYDIVDATPFRRDVVRELADACRDEGLKLGFYYSLMDWHRPDYPTGREKKARASVAKGQEDYDSYLAFMKAQLTELLTNYGDVLCVWFDGEWDHDPNDVNSKGLQVPTLDWRFEELYAHVHRLQPKCLILNNHHHAMRDGEDIQGFERDAPGENKAGLSPGQKVEREFPLETCDTMTKGAWGYQVGVTGYKSPAELRSLLKSTNDKGANLLLNVGPQPDGSLPVRAVEILSELGKDGASWITYPGDFGVYLGEKVQARRPEWNGYTPVMWPQYHHWTLVEFAKEVDLSETEEVDVRVCGTGSLLVPGVRHPFTFDREKVVLPKGRYRLSAKIFNPEKPPALFIDGKTVKTGRGWTASWDGISWMKASADGGFKSPDMPPGDFRLEREHLEPVKVVREGDAVLADFGRETFGYLKFRGVKGRGRIKIVWAESEAEARAEPLEDLPFGEDVVDVWETIDLFEADEYVYEKSRGFRYVRFAPVEGDVTVDSVAMDYEYLPLERRGSFRCDDDRLNRIWDVGAYTLSLTMREVMVEGLKRDRWCWSGDAYQSFLMNYYVFADSDSVKRTLWAMRGKDPVRRHVNTIMDYTFFWFAAVKDYYLYTGDSAFLEEIYPAMVAQMDFCLSRLDERGMAVSRPGDWVFVDWAPKPLDNNSGPVAFEQIMLVRGLEAMAECASVCGRTKESKDYAERAAELRAKVLPVFWSEKAGGLVHNLDADGRQSPTITRYPNMFGILHGYFDAAQTERVVKDVLLNDNVMEIQTPYMRYYELEALCMAGLHEKVTDEIRSYWGAMLDLGATTFWELYNPKEKGSEHYAMYGRPFGKSLCHAWGASPLYLLGRYYLGVRPTKPGFAAYDVVPSLGGLKEIEGAVPTPTGPVKVSIRDGRCVVTGNGGTGTLRWNGRTAVIAPHSTVEMR